MKRVLTTVLAVALLLGLGALAVLAMPSANAPLAAAPVVSAAAPEAVDAGGKYNTIALPLDNGITLASALVTDINATTAGTATQVWKWDPTLGYSIYDPADLLPDDFTLKVGDAVWVVMEGSGELVYSMVGDVPAEDSVHFDLVGTTPPSCRFNFVSVPLDQGSITSASQLATAIGDVSQIWSWDPITGYSIYDPADLLPDDFTVRIGYPYFVCMTATKTWPPLAVP